MRKHLNFIAGFALFALSVSSACAQTANGSGPGQTVNGVPVGGTGSGTGDFAGPASSTADDFVQFSGTGGKTGKDGGYGPASFAPAGAIADVVTSQSVHAADVAACKMYRASASSLNFTFDAASGLSTNGCIEIETLGNSAQVTANAVDTITFAGVTTSTGGNVTLPVYGLYRITIKAGNIDIAGVSAQGDAAKVLRATGSFVTGNAIKTDANGNAIDAGVAAGGSGGGGADLYAIANKWYNTKQGTTGNGMVVGTATTQFSSFTIDKGATIDTLGGRTAVVDAAGHWKGSIYLEDATTHRPTGSPLCTTPDITLASGSQNGACAAVIPSAGRVWLGFQTDSATGAIGAVLAGAYDNVHVGTATQTNLSGSGTSGVTEYKVTGTTYGTMPVFPTATLTEAGSTTAQSLQIQVHINTVP